MRRSNQDRGWEVEPGCVRVGPQLVAGGIVAKYDIVASPPADGLRLPLEGLGEFGQNYILVPAEDSTEPSFMKDVGGRPARWYEPQGGSYSTPYSVAALAKKERLPIIALPLHADESQVLSGDPEEEAWGLPDAPEEVELDLGGHVGLGAGVISFDTGTGIMQRLAFRALVRPQRFPDSVYVPHPGSRGVGRVAMFWLPLEDGPRSPDAMRDFPDPTEGLFTDS